jgi:hypothetical protein
MRVYLSFLERSQSSLPHSCCALLLFLHHFQSTEFYEIVISPNQNLSECFVVVVYLEFLFVVSVRWMKY